MSRLFLTKRTRDALKMTIFGVSEDSDLETPVRKGVGARFEDKVRSVVTKPHLSVKEKPSCSRFTAETNVFYLSAPFQPRRNTSRA